MASRTGAALGAVARGRQAARRANGKSGERVHVAASSTHENGLNSNLTVRSQAKSWLNQPSAKTHAATPASVMPFQQSRGLFDLTTFVSSLAGSSVAVGLGVAATVALQRRQQTTVQSKQTYLKNIKDSLEKKYKPNHRRTLEKLPVFNRGDHDEIKKILTTSKYAGKVVLIQAPAGTGKTTVIDSMLDGRPRVVTIPLSEKVVSQRDAGVRILNDVLECRISDTLIPQVNFNTLLGYWEEVVTGMSKKDTVPLLWIDDVQRGLDSKTGRFFPEFDSFLSWCASMSDRMTVIITGSPPVEDNLRAVPGFASRLVVHQLPTLESNALEISRALQEKYHLSSEQADTVLAKLGGSLEDIGDFLMSKINGMPFQQALDSVIAKGHGDIFNALIGKARPADISKYDWVACVYNIFSRLVNQDTVDLLQLNKEMPPAITIDTLARVVEKLVEVGILAWKVDHAVVGYRAPRYRAAYQNQSESHFIKTMLKNLKISTLGTPNPN